MEESSIFLVLFKGSFNDPRYCSLAVLRSSRERGFQKNLGYTRGTIR